MANGINRLTIIGAGAMGAAFASGVISAGLLEAGSITLADVDEARLKQVADKLGVSFTTSNQEACRGADVILIAVKPGIVFDVLSDISEVINTDQLLISIAAGVKLSAIELELPDEIGVIRAMPNTPCQIGAGAIGFSRGGFVSEEQAARASSIFDAVGLSYEVSDKQLDAVTGLSGSGPAYVYVMIEALSDAGVRVGLPRNIATDLAAQTVYGAAKMVLETREHPAKLKDQVTSPGGTTIAGVEALERNGFRSALIEAVKAATHRSEELG